MKPIFIGVGGSGLNIVETWQKIGGNGMCLSSENEPKKGVQLFTTLEELEKRIDSSETYVVTGGLAGNTFSKYGLTILNRLIQNQIPFYILGFFPFEFERKRKNENALKLHNQLSNFKNYCFVDLQEYREEFGNMPSSKAFESLDEIGIEIVLKAIKESK